jgi:23S rRNA (guanosine2251-2'-O)-methyltransferase
MKGSRDGILNQVEAHAKAKGIPFDLETRNRMDTMAGHDKHQGVIAVAEDYKYADLSDLLREAQGGNRQPFFLLLDEIEDPQNLGAILRSADAAGVDGVLIPKNRAAEVNATVIKVSAGAAEHVRTVKVVNLNDSLKKLKEEGVWVVGADAEGGRNFYEYDFKRPVALVIGNEGKGLRRLVKENCDDLVRIPMAGKVASLNASVATALLLFEVVRQRKWGSSTAVTTPTYSAPITFPRAGYSPPERDFFRSGPDPALETPDEGAPSEVSPDEGTGSSPGQDKGGGFRW